MKNIQLPILITSALLVIYILTTRFESFWKISIILFIILHVALIWMVLTVLKKGVASKYTFQERFYEDKSMDELDVF